MILKFLFGSICRLIYESYINITSNIYMQLTFMFVCALSLFLSFNWSLMLYYRFILGFVLIFTWYKVQIFYTYTVQKTIKLYIFLTIFLPLHVKHHILLPTFFFNTIARILIVLAKHFTKSDKFFFFPKFLMWIQACNS